MGNDRSREPLLLIGAGGLAREVAEVVHAINTIQGAWRLVGFIDDDPRLHGRDVDGAPVLGGLEVLGEHPDARVVVCTASPTDYGSRSRIARRSALPEERFATLVHPTASIATTAVLGAGSVVMAGVVMTAAVTVGRHVVIMPGSVLTHDGRLDDYVTVASGVRLGGGVRVQRGAYLGSGALVREQLDVGEWSLVGMGAVVTRSVPARQTWAGVPARFLGAAPIIVHEEGIPA
jgi:sugar O-acyltransferase (sialic acid O-acetyltransferase NeuD family)